MTSAGSDGDPVTPAVGGDPVPVGRGTRRGAGRPAVVVAGAIVAVLAGTVLFLSGWTLGRQAALTPGTPQGELEAFQPFWDTYRAVTERYAGGEVDRDALIEGAIKGMIGALEDPHSFYMTSDEYRESLRDISGEFEGIGATIGTVDAAGANTQCGTLGPDCRLAVAGTIPGSPAEEAGLRAGDRILRIDGETVDGETVDVARDRIRGARGTTVVLAIQRDGAEIEVPIVRAVVVVPDVEERDIDDGRVGYIRLLGFSEHAAEELEAALRDDLDAGRRSIVLDLRGNPGGFITAARSIASEFLADGTIFWQEDADGALVETAAEEGGVATDTGIRVVVLVDGGTASAAEIVAGALRDRGRATLVGVTTYGKGTVQQWTQLEHDSGGFRLTVARWLTPDRTWIHGTGIEPDVVVETAPARPGDDPVLERALELLGATGAALRRAA